jgi:hypothetical protein
MKINGRLQLDIFKTVDGKKIKIGGFDDTNLITLSGKQVMAYLMAGEPGTHKVSKFGIGTGDSFPDDYDVGLTNAFINNTTGYYFLEPTVVQWYFSVPAHEGTGLVVTEFGLFSEAEQLFARKIRTPGITKDSSISFSGAWTIWLAECKRTTFLSYVVFDWNLVSQIDSSNVVSIQPLIEHSITSSGNVARILASQADIASDIGSTFNRDQDFVSTANIVSNISDPTFDFTNVERRFSVSVNYFHELNDSLIFNLGEFSTQVDIESAISDSLIFNTAGDFTSQVDIVFDISDPIFEDGE